MDHSLLSDRRHWSPADNDFGGVLEATGDLWLNLKRVAFFMTNLEQYLSVRDTILDVTFTFDKIQVNKKSENFKCKIK